MRSTFGEMPWMKVFSTDSRGRALADRHYSRQKPGATRWIKPARCVAMIVPNDGRAIAAWASSWPFPEYVKHEWAGAWECALFRNESTMLASELILLAVAVTRHVWGDPPEGGMITFIDPAKVRPTKVRGKPTWGYCYLKAGFVACGETKGGKLAFHLDRAKMPDPHRPYEEQFSMADFFD